MAEKVTYIPLTPQEWQHWKDTALLEGEGDTIDKFAATIGHLFAVNTHLLEALERTAADLRDIIRLVREGHVDPRSDWPRAAAGLIQADAAIKKAK